MEVTCGCVACVVGHCRDREGEVALYKYGIPPPFGPGVVSSGVGSEFWRSDRVELRNGRVGRMLEDESVGLGLLSEGVVFEFGWVEGDAVVLLSIFPGCCRLDGVDYLKKGLGGGR